MSFNSEARLWISVKFEVIRLDWPTSNDVIAMEFARANRSAAANRFWADFYFDWRVIGRGDGIAFQSCEHDPLATMDFDLLMDSVALNEI